MILLSIFSGPGSEMMFESPEHALGCLILLGLFGLAVPVMCWLHDRGW